MTIGRTIKLLRTAAGLKQKDLAEQLGVSAKYLSLVENDRREPSLSFLRKFAQVMDVPLGLLFVGEPSPTTRDEELEQISEEMRELILRLAQMSVRARKREQEETKTREADSNEATHKTVDG